MTKICRIDRKAGNFHFSAKYQDQSPLIKSFEERGKHISKLIWYNLY